MPCVGAVPLLVSILVALSLGLVVWGVIRIRETSANDTTAGSRDDLLVGALILAAFSAGVFSTFILLSFAGC